MPKPHKRKYLWLFILFLVVAMVGGGIWYYNAQQLHEDCMITATVDAWIDENANGAWDDGEIPLEGVEFHVDDILNSYTDVGNRSISNQNGKASIDVWLPGCPKTRFELYAMPPSGYRLTTKARLRMGGVGYRGNGDPLRFGFTPLRETPTPAP